MCEIDRRPNILLITSDQQHWSTLGSLGGEVITPNLDRLAREGTTFTRAYCPNPTCSPTRASIITGKYPSQHGCWTLGTKLPESEHTVGEDFAHSGYRTALVGKAHFQPMKTTEAFTSIESAPLVNDLDYWRNFHGPYYGFEHVELARNHGDEPSVGQHYALWMEEKGFTRWRECFRAPGGTADAQYGKWNLPEEFHYNTWIAERTNALMESYVREGRNFFVWASFFDPHPPYLVPHPWDEMYDPEALTLPRRVEGEHEKNPPHFQLTQVRNPDFSYVRENEFYLHGLHSHVITVEQMKRNMAIYYGMVSLLDKYVGKVLDKLDELGIADETLVVFTTDHGHLYGQHGLRAKGPFHYEDLLRIPFIVRYPGRVPAGRRSDALQSLVDLAPTFLSFAGIERPWGMSGLDQSSVWTGEAAEVRDHVVVENRVGQATLHLKTYVDKRYKITVYHNQPYGELFDLEEDPGEFNNLWNDPASQGLKHELIQRLLFAEMGKEPIRMPRIAGA